MEREVPHRSAASSIIGRGRCWGRGAFCRPPSLAEFLPYVVFTGLTLPFFPVVLEVAVPLRGVLLPAACYLLFLAGVFLAVVVDCEEDLLVCLLALVDLLSAAVMVGWVMEGRGLLARRFLATICI